jgi:uncharacterized protein (TIGR03083 family)
VSRQTLVALREECDALNRDVLYLSEEAFAKPTRLPAWNVKELFGHVHRSINDRLTTALRGPSPEAPEVDSVTYFRSYDPATDSGDVADRAKGVAAGFATGHELAVAWAEAWPLTLARAAEADPERVVVTFGPAIRFDEYLKTRVLEITVHRMDLEHALGRKGWGTDEAISIVDDILVGLLGEQPPSNLDWDAIDFIDTGTGRRPLSDRERRMLGRLAGRFPLLA